MALTTEDSRRVASIRLKLVQNMKNGLPPEHEIDKEELKELIQKVRDDRSIGAASSSKSASKAPSIPLDLGAFMGKK